jgi:hypothetical protein
LNGYESLLVHEVLFRKHGSPRHRFPRSPQPNNLDVAAEYSAVAQNSALQVLARLMAGDEFDETMETCVERDSEGNASQLGRIDLLQLDPERD